MKTKILNRILSLILVISFILVSAPIHVNAMRKTEENLIAGRNSGFEDGELGKNWTKSDQGEIGVKVTVTDIEKHSGSYSALIENRDNNNDGTHIKVDVEKNTEYYISAWVKPAGSKKARGTIRMVANGGSDISLLGQKDFPLGEWTKTCGIINSGNNTSVSLRIHTNSMTDESYDNKSFYVDDFEICKIVNVSEIYDEKNMLKEYDSGFENGEIDTAKWNLSGSCTVRTDEKAYTGNWSAYSSNRKETYNGPQAQNIRLEANAKYYASAWVYTDAEDEKAKIRLQGTGVSIPADVDLVPGEWTQVSAIMTTTDAVTAKCYINTTGKSDIYIDDFVVYRVYKKNMVSNSGFETGELGDEWVLNNQSEKAKVEITCEEKHSGIYSALVSSRANNNDGPQITVPVEANTNYYISAWVKPKHSSSGGRGTIRMVANGGSNIDVPTYTDFPAGEWTYVSALVNTGTNKSVNLRIHTNIISSSTYNNEAFYVDDFEMYPCKAEGSIGVNPEGISSENADGYLWDFSCNPGTAHILAGWQVQKLQKVESVDDTSVICNYYSLKPDESNGLTRLNIEFAGASIATAKDKPISLDADKYKYISIKAENNSNSNSFIIGFSANGLSDVYYELNYVDGDGIQEIILDMTDCPDWVGNIDSMVLFPAYSESSGDIVLESISVFSPQKTDDAIEGVLTCGNFLKMLTDAFGFIRYSDSTDTNFADDSVLIAMETGIIDENAEFDSEKNITRENAAKLLMNACTYLDKQTERTVVPVVFSDISKFSEGMITYASWAGGLGIISGVGENKFEPQGLVNYNEACDMISRATAWADGTSEDNEVFVSAPVTGTYDVVRLTVNDENGSVYTNPYDFNEVKADAVFTAPNGEIFVIPGYFDMMRDFEYDPRRQVKDVFQSSQWKFRFTPTMSGRWKFEIQLTFNGSKSIMGKGQITAIDSGRRGFIRADENNSRFVYDNGDVFNGFGINTYGPKGEDGANYIVHERYFKNYAQKNGTNLWRIWFENLTRGLETSVTGIGKFDNAFAQELDYTMLLARQNGVVILPSIKTHQFLVDGEALSLAGPYMETSGGPLSTGVEFFSNTQTKRSYKNLLRFIIARYSAYDNLLCWELWNEEEAITGWRDAADTVSAWHDEMLGFLEETDPYGHITGSSGKTIAGESMLFEKDLTDYTCVHSYNMVQPALMIRADAEIKREQYGNKPNIIEELSIREELFEADKNGSITHETLWSSIAAGNAGATPSWWWESWMEKNQHWKIFKPIAGFVEDLNWPDENLELVNFKTTSAQKGDFIIPAGYYYPEQYNYSNLPVKDNFGVYNFADNPVRDVKDIIYETSVRKGDFYTFNVNLPQTTNFVVATVGAPIRPDANGTLEIYVDPEYYSFSGTLKSKPVYKKDILVDNYITKHTVSVPAGEHTIKIRNNDAEGQSFYIGWVAFENTVPRIAAEGAVGDNSAVIYVRDTKTVYSENVNSSYTPVQITDATVELTGLNDGTYNLVWWDTYEGVEVSSEKITITNGETSVVKVPAFTKDIAAKIVPVTAEIPKLSSNIADIDNVKNIITITEEVADTFSSIDDIKDIISVDKECSVTVNDNDNDGFLSYGDTVVVVPVNTYIPYTYTVNVTAKVNADAESFTIDGESVGNTITKTGAAYIKYSITNNMLSNIAPVVFASLYDENNCMKGCAIEMAQTIKTGEKTDVELRFDIPGYMKKGYLGIFVLGDTDNLNPLKRPEKYLINVDDLSYLHIK